MNTLKTPHPNTVFPFFTARRRAAGALGLAALNLITACSIFRSSEEAPKPVADIQADCDYALPVFNVSSLRPSQHNGQSMTVSGTGTSPQGERWNDALTLEVTRDGIRTDSRTYTVEDVYRNPGMVISGEDLNGVVKVMSTSPDAQESTMNISYTCGPTQLRAQDVRP